MSREYTIKLSEKDIYRAIPVLEVIYEDVKKQNQTMGDLCISETIKDILQKLKQAKQKSYTNFDKIKDEMSLSDLVHISEDGVTYQDIQSLDKNIKVFQGEEKAKQWLESEVKENDT